MVLNLDHDQHHNPYGKLIFDCIQLRQWFESIQLSNNDNQFTVMVTNQLSNNDNQFNGNQFNVYTNINDNQWMIFTLIFQSHLNLMVISNEPIPFFSWPLSRAVIFRGSPVALVCRCGFPNPSREMVMWFELFCGQWKICHHSPSHHHPNWSLVSYPISSVQIHKREKKHHQPW